MNRISLFIVSVFIGFIIFSCGSNKQSNEGGENGGNIMKEGDSSKGDNKGIGKFSHVELTHPLDEAMVSKGKPIYEAKCFACHKLTGEKLVGPGWKGVTDRRAPEWILNFITNTSVMLDSDLIAQKMFVTCLVRMPSQGLSDDEARSMLEFMRKNDGKN